MSLSSSSAISASSPTTNFWSSEKFREKEDDENVPGERIIQTLQQMNNNKASSKGCFTKELVFKHGFHLYVLFQRFPPKQKATIFLPGNSKRRINTTRGETFIKREISRQNPDKLTRPESS